MDLELLDSTLTDWVGKLAETPVRWRRRAPQALPFPHVLLETGVFRAVGQDRRHFEYDAEADRTSLLMIGLRRFTLQLAFRSRRSNGAAEDAERFRTRLARPDSVRTLSAADLALVGSGPLEVADYEDRNGRLVSQRLLRLEFEGRSVEEDPTWDGSYIGAVNIQAQWGTDQ